jgi:succinate dehydrogenase / fumarate reductase cytochrome b subunit
MSLSGLFLFSFLLVHLTINLFLLKQDRGATFDVYAEFMATYPIVRPLEIVLFAGFLLHALLGIWLWVTNRGVRASRYKVSGAAQNSDLPSRVAFWSGAVVAVFLIVHVNSFFVSSRFFPDGRTMYELVAEAFASPAVVAFYVFAMVLLGFHLKHGFQSAFQTLGLRTGRYRRLIEAVGVVFWLLVPAAFASIPLIILWTH